MSFWHNKKKLKNIKQRKNYIKLVGVLKYIEWMSIRPKLKEKLFL